MQREIVIAESDYDEIIRWDDDGALACDVVYRIVPDSVVARSFMHTRRAFKSYEEGQESAEETPEFELTELAKA